MTYEEDYQKIRDLLLQLHSRIIKQLSREDMLTSARHLGMLRKKTFMFNNETEVAILSDYQVYSYRPRGISMVGQFLNMKRSTLDPFAIEMLEAMSRTRYSIYVIDQIQSGKGVTTTDLFRRDSLFLADRGLSATAEPEMAFAMRLIVFDDFAIQTGAGVPVDQDLVLKPDIVKALEKFMPPLVDGKFSFTAEQDARLARILMTAAIQHGYTGNIEYA